LGSEKGGGAIYCRDLVMYGRTARMGPEQMREFVYEKKGRKLHISCTKRVDEFVFVLLGWAFMGEGVRLKEFFV
jgi:hypothetical protein